MKEIIIVVVTFGIGYFLGTARTYFTLINNPHKLKEFEEMVNKNPSRSDKKSHVNKPPYPVYIEHDDGKFYAYALEHNKFEATANTYDDLVFALCEKYPNNTIVICEE